MRLLALLLISSLAALTPLRAGDSPETAEAELQSDPEPEQTRPVLRLTIEKAVEMALAKNFQIQVQSFSPLIARQQTRQALGRFDPTLGVTYLRGENTLRSPLSSITQHDTLNVGLSGVTALGTSYNLGSNIRDTRVSPEDFSNNFNTAATFGLTQPLLRGFGPAANLVSVRLARRNETISGWALRQRVMDVITQIYYAYNELFYAQESLRVATQSQALAERLLGENTQRARIGTMTPLDVTTARADVASRRERVLLAAGAVRDNEVLLNQLTGDSMEDILFTRVEIEPPPSLVLSVDTMEGIRNAFERRPDYRSALLDIEKRRITVAFERNAVLPRLDLTGSLNLLGVDPNFSTSFGNAATRDQSEWTAGAIFSLPIPNREASGRANAAQLSAAQALVDLKRLEQEIIVRVDTAARQISTSRERIRATHEASVLAQESLEAGEQRLRIGTATTFEVLGLQDKLRDARLAEARARADYNKAVAEFDRQTGTTIEHNRVRVP